MAGQIPDPGALNSWEDAFQQPLPVVRKLEQQLRKNIDDHRQKLRSLVGASYRDLLGTAERIIEMDQQMESVESILGDVGRRCNARTMEKMAENGAQMRKSLKVRDADKYGAMAQTRVLQSTLTMVLRIVKGDGDALQASKLLVLSRLLYKSISEGAFVPLVLEELRRKLAMLRKRLLSYITAAMVKPSEDKILQANTLCAYALVTSSTPKEVLRHFLQVRYEQLDNHTDSSSEADIIEMLDLYGQTLLDTRDLFPRRFSETLIQLAKIPLLRDRQVQSAFELNLDIYGSWIAEDVRTFIPWVRHDQLGSSEVSDALGSWTRQAQECVLRGVQDFVDHQADASIISNTRRKIISKYMSLSGKLRHEDHAKTIHALREAFLQRLKDLAMKAAAVDDLSFDDSNISSSNSVDSRLQSMWHLAAEDLDVSHGALKLRRSIVQKRNSRTASIQAAGVKLDQWIGSINGILDLIDNLRGDKWDTYLDLDLDDIDDSDILLQALNKQDPDALQEHLREAAATALQQLAQQVASAGESNPVLYIRVWREVCNRHRILEPRLAVPIANLSLFALHRNLAQSVTKDAIEAYARFAKESSRVAVELWDGSPALPVQPSPAAFRFLKMLHQAMSSAGNDLWGRNAIRALKVHALGSLGAEFDTDEFANVKRDVSLIKGHVGQDNGEDNAEQLPNGVAVIQDSKKNLLLQHSFDVRYLRRVLQCQTEGESERGGLSHIVKTISQQLELDETSSERLNKNANDYWRRTYLLFGLLAPG